MPAQQERKHRPARGDRRKTPWMEGRNGGRLKRGNNWGNRGGGRPTTHGRYAVHGHRETAGELAGKEERERAVSARELRMIIERMGEIVDRHVQDPSACSRIRAEWLSISVERWFLGWRPFSIVRALMHQER